MKVYLVYSKWKGGGKLDAIFSKKDDAKKLVEYTKTKLHLKSYYEEWGVEE